MKMSEYVKNETSYKKLIVRTMNWPTTVSGHKGRKRK